MQEIIIDNFKICDNSKPYIIAEISANHNGAIEKALKLIDIAKDCGAHAVKLQTYTADTITIKSKKDDFLIKEGPWKGANLYELYDKAHTPWEWHKTLFEKAKQTGITIFSTPFDESAVDFLEELEVPAYKIASFEATDLPLINYIAQTKKPIILSTGMANLQEISEAVETIRKHHNNFILLHCISAYPAPPEEMNLKTIEHLSQKFECYTGLSDHTLSNTCAITSVGLGAKIIEKHFTHSRLDPGPDSSFSLEPKELRSLCVETQIAWQGLGTVNYERKKSEESNIKFRRSIYFTENIKKGELITPRNIRRIRPGYGSAPKLFPQFIGKKAKQDIEKGTPAHIEDVE